MEMGKGGRGIPKGSSTTILESSFGRSMIVGWMKYPVLSSFLPPTATFHPSFSISLKNPLTRSYCMEF